jgi:hypothetical protein
MEGLMAARTFAAKRYERRHSASPMAVRVPTSHQQWSSVRRAHFPADGAQLQWASRDAWALFTPGRGVVNEDGAMRSLHCVREWALARMTPDATPTTFAGRENITADDA